MDTLPFEIKEKIFSNLDTYSRLSLNGTNRALRNVNLSIILSHVSFGAVIPYMIDQKTGKINRHKMNVFLLALNKFPGIKHLSFDTSFKSYTKNKCKSRSNQLVHMRWRTKHRRMTRDVGNILKILNRVKIMNGRKFQTLDNLKCINFDTKLLSGRLPLYMFDVCKEMEYLIVNSKDRAFKFDPEIVKSQTLGKLKLLKLTGFLENHVTFTNLILPKCLNLRYLYISYDPETYMYAIPHDLFNTIFKLKHLEFLHIPFRCSLKEYIHLLDIFHNLNHIEISLTPASLLEQEGEYSKYHRIKSLVLHDSLFNGPESFETVKIALGCVPNLQSLTINLMIGDAYLKYIATSFPGLKKLSLKFWKISPEGLGYLKTGCLNLEVVYLYFNFNDFDLYYHLKEFIENHKMLKKLIVFTGQILRDIQLLNIINPECKVVREYLSDPFPVLPSVYHPVQDYINNNINN